MQDNITLNPPRNISGVYKSSYTLKQTRIEILQTSLSMGDLLVDARR